MGPEIPMPALAIRRSMRPLAAAIPSMQAFTAVSSVTSQTQPVTPSGAVPRRLKPYTM